MSSVKNSMHSTPTHLTRNYQKFPRHCSRYGFTITNSRSFCPCYPSCLAILTTSLLCSDEHWDWFEKEEMAILNMTGSNRIATVLMYLTGESGPYFFPLITPTFMAFESLFCVGSGVHSAMLHRCGGGWWDIILRLAMAGWEAALPRVAIRMRN